MHFPVMTIKQTIGWFLLGWIALTWIILQNSKPEETKEAFIAAGIVSGIVTVGLYLIQ